MLEKLLDIIFPPKCELCKKLGGYICNNCYKELQKYELENNSNVEYFFYLYIEKIRSMILNYKFNDGAYLANLFSYCILNKKSAIEFINQYDVIVPVPLHKKRKLERGYNQSELVIKNISKKETMPIIYSNILIKTKNTKPQSTNKLQDRVNSVKGIYKVHNIDRIINKKVLVFDDIYTTGNTYNECKKALLNAGASSVGIMTIARDFME